MPRVMAFDPGERRIGVAVSDESGLLASPASVLIRSSRSDDLRRIKELVMRYQPAELLVGLALLPSGEPGLQARRGARFADLLQRETGLPVRLWNESYSTVEAQRRRGLQPGRQQRQRHLDAEAAAVFLQEYLDTVR